MSIEYIEINKEELSIIEKLWENLNQLHSDLSPFFSEEYLNKKFMIMKYQ